MAVHRCGRAAVVEEEEAQPHAASGLVAGDARQPGRDAESCKTVRPRWRAGWQRPPGTLLLKMGHTLRFETGGIIPVHRNGLAQAEVGHGRARSVCRATERAEGFPGGAQIAPGSGKGLDAQLTEGVAARWEQHGIRVGVEADRALRVRGHRPRGERHERTQGGTEGTTWPLIFTLSRRSADPKRVADQRVGRWHRRKL